MRKNKSEKSELEKLHPYGLKGLFEVYGGFSFLLKPSFYVAFGLSMTTFFVVYFGDFKNIEVLSLISRVTEIGLSLDGGLIGLTLAGLTLIVTFGSERLLRHMVKLNVETALKEERLPSFSSYQTAVAKFGFAVFVQIITLIILFGFSLVTELNLSFEDEGKNLFYNCLFLSLALFMVLYSLFLVVQMTINIFTISQMNHGVYFSDSVKEVLEEDKKI